MQHTLVVALALGTLAIGWGPGVVATHDPADDVECTVTSSTPDVDTTLGVAVFIDEELLPGTASVWIYQESNSLAGYQRGDSIVDDEDCTHGDDAIIF